MGSPINSVKLKLSRKQLTEIFNNNPVAVKAFENLFDLVGLLIDNGDGTLAITFKNTIPRGQLNVAETTIYTAVNCTSIIDKMTVTNTSAAAVDFWVHLVAFQDDPSNANAVIFQRTVDIDEIYPCTELEGQILNPGDYISARASAGASLTISGAGREIA